MNSRGLAIKIKLEKLKETKEYNKEKAVLETYPRIHILIVIINNL